MVGGNRAAGPGRPPPVPVRGGRAPPLLAPLQLLSRRARHPRAPGSLALRVDERCLAPMAGSVDDRPALLPLPGRNHGGVPSPPPGPPPPPDRPGCVGPRPPPPP